MPKSEPHPWSHPSLFRLPRRGVWFSFPLNDFHPLTLGPNLGLGFGRREFFGVTHFCSKRFSGIGAFRRPLRPFSFCPGVFTLLGGFTQLGDFFVPFFCFFLGF